MRQGETRNSFSAHCILACCVLMVVLGAGCSAGRTISDPSPLRVLTFNIHHGEGTDGRVDVKRIADLILSSGADIVALQEVDRWVERSGKLDMIVNLSELTGFTYAFGKTMTYLGGEYGNGVLTRFPILEERNIAVRGHDTVEPRNVMQLLLDVRGREVWFLNTHLDHSGDERHRLEGVRTILSVTAPCSVRAVILCGDFNATPDERPIRELRTYFQDAWEAAGTGAGCTYPSAAPNRRLDYVFLCPTADGDTSARGGWRVRKASMLCSSASDHCAVLVELFAGSSL
jgi:endonuclease/exonuclease/phosphatase family metal-dependent hydrolase